MRKILYSPGFGAGWSSWSSGELARFMLEYQPLVDALEGPDADAVRNDCRGAFWDSSRELDPARTHPVVTRFVEECQERFGEVPYLGGLRDLQVATVNGRVRIHEYDGSERVEEEGSYEGWL